MAGDSMCQNATWPTLTAQSSQVVPAESAVLKVVRDNDLWDEASDAWKAAIVQRGAVLQKPDSENYFVALGDVVMCAQLL